MQIWLGCRNTTLTMPDQFWSARAREKLQRRVALDAVARAFLEQTVGIQIMSHVLSIGGVGSGLRIIVPTYEDRERVDADPVRSFDPVASAAMVAEIDAAHSAGDTLGGVIEVLAFHLTTGLGSHTHWDRRLDARLAGAMMGIQAIKGVEIGDGFTTANVAVR